MNPPQEGKPKKVSAAVPNSKRAERDARLAFIKDLPRDDREFLKAAAQRIRLNLAKQIDAAIAVGKDLVAARKACGRGHFLGWLEAELTMSASTANRYMALAGFEPERVRQFIVATREAEKARRDRQRNEFLAGEGRGLPEDLAERLSEINATHKALQACDEEEKQRKARSAKMAADIVKRYLPETEVGAFTRLLAEAGALQLFLAEFTSTNVVYLKRRGEPSP